MLQRSYPNHLIGLAHPKGFEPLASAFGEYKRQVCASLLEL
jgi:hypothetical protein